MLTLPFPLVPLNHLSQWKWPQNRIISIWKLLLQLNCPSFLYYCKQLCAKYRKRKFMSIYVGGRGVFNHRSSNRVKTQGLIPLSTLVAQEEESASAAGDSAQRFAQVIEGCVDFAFPEHLCCTGPLCCWWESQGEALTQTQQSTAPWLALALLCFWLTLAEHFSAHSFLALALVPRNSSQSP